MFLFLSFIYVLSFGFSGPLLQRGLFFTCGSRSSLCCGAQASHCRGFSDCGAWASVGAALQALSIGSTAVAL